MGVETGIEEGSKGDRPEGEEGNVREVGEVGKSRQLDQV